MATSHAHPLPGSPAPLGATWDGSGTNFALFSEHAEQVELLLFHGASDQTPSRTVGMSERTDFVWHCYLPGVRPGNLYAYRIHGPYEPARGHRFNHHKLLIDPYAVALTSPHAWHDSLMGYDVDDPDDDLSMSRRDSASWVPRCVVGGRSYDWNGDRPLCRPWNETVLYETHVKGLTMLHPEVPARQRGAYAGASSPPVIEHLRRLGVTAVQLLPVHQHALDRSLAGRGMTNYWGYNTIGFFAPDCRYSSSGTAGQQIDEFRDMVRAFHRAGIEVILDVVYNHTAEGDHLGPTLCFRGIDNASYYHLRPDNPRYYLDFTGCGCSLNVTNPHVLRMVLDSLRYWVEQMHVDGFRFDLAAALAREKFAFSRTSPFLCAIHQDPVLSRVKLIAEPWDLGPGGYQAGAFPVLWAELNGRFRDDLRSYWKGDAHRRANLSYRLSGSSDLYSLSGRSPLASINHITSHDGFTLEDLVSYERKHNEANGERNQDGHNHDESWNCGIEGPTDLPDIRALRLRQKANFMACLALAQGVPMIQGGDELGRSQQGNNNAYCQDNATTWYNWDLSEEQQGFMRLMQGLFSLRRLHPVLRRRHFFRGRVGVGGLKDVTWLRHDGRELGMADWTEASGHAMGMMLDGAPVEETDNSGRSLGGDTLLLMLSSSPRDIEFRYPAGVRPLRLLLDTGRGLLSEKGEQVSQGVSYGLRSRSVVLLIVEAIHSKG